jgi:hypothetical protein
VAHDRIVVLPHGVADAFTSYAKIALATLLPMLV